MAAKRNLVAIQVYALTTEWMFMGLDPGSVSLSVVSKRVFYELRINMNMDLIG